jgi:hypothetical protein
MKQIKTSVYFIVVTSVLFQISCNNTATTLETNDMDKTLVASNTDTSAMPPYDPAMDAYNVGGEAIKKLGDTLGVKMYEFTAKPGDSAALHSHPDHAVYVLQGGKLAVTFQGKGRQIMDLKTGTGFIGGPLSDAGKNVGNTTVKLLIVDIYRPRGK